MFSEKFQDIYFQTNGIEESRYVFIEGNSLFERFVDKKNFSICELGFGTGLNFFLTSKIFLNINHNGILYYYGIEKYPLSLFQIFKALKNFKEIYRELDHWKEIFKNIYYPINGFHTIYFHSRIRLTLLIGDVLEMLKSIPDTTKFDAWYLDGFSPSKNPEMWKEEIYYEMARLSYYRSTFATFTSASFVRKGLEKANFVVMKKKGFGKKREMIHGYYNYPSIQKQNIPSFKIAVIGAGISGISTSLLLLQRGFYVELFDINSDILQGTSGIPSALLAPYFSNQKNILSEFTIKGYNIFVSYLMNIFPSEFKSFFLKNTLVEKSSFKEKITNFIKIYNISNSCIRKYKNYYFLSRSGIIIMNEFLTSIKKYLCEFPHSFRFIPHTKIIDILNNKNTIYLQDHKNNIYEFDCVIFCNSNNIHEFSILKPIDWNPVRGQLVSFSKKYIKDIIKIPIISEISLYALKDKIVIGSSFEHNSKNLERNYNSDQYLLKKLENNFNKIFQVIANKESGYYFKIPTEAFIGIRSQSIDYLPVAGRIPDWENFILYLKNLIPNKRYYYKDMHITEYKNLYINSCHGSRGYTTSFLCGDLIASLIDNNPLPIEKEYLYNLSPARFVFRKWRSSQNRKNFNLE